jgi:4'-phosphopantetheinyl transferase EntD
MDRVLPSEGRGCWFDPSRARQSNSFKSLLPPQAVVFEHCGEPPAEMALAPEEERFVAQARASRRREFALGRHLARRALAALGIPPGPIGVGAARQPLFPSGTSASITHTHGFCAAAAVRIGQWSSIGIDAEPATPLGDDVAPLVLRPEERDMAASVDRRLALPCAGKLVFSAKEAFYKAYFQIEGRYLDFNEARVTLNDDGCFAIEVLKADVGAFFRHGSFEGRYAIFDGRAHAGIALPFHEIA